MWLVVVPVSYHMGKEESERTLIVGKIAKEFGRMTNIVLAILVLTGIYNVTWYLPSMSSLFTTTDGLYLLTKVILVGILIAMIYGNNIYFGRRTTRFAREKKFEELKALRRKSRVISFTSLGLMAAILFLAVMLQIPL